jgi:transposase
LLILKYKVMDKKQAALYFVGIDVSKKTIDAAIDSTGKHKVFPNTDEGLVQMLSWADAGAPGASFCLEHCGMYAHRLCLLLSARERTHYLVGGLAVKRSLGITRGKNDRADAFSLARFARLYHAELRPYRLPGEDILRLRGLLALRARLVKQLAGHKAYLKEAAAAMGLGGDDTAVQCTGEVMAVLKKQIKAIEAQIMDGIEGSPSLARTYRLITAIKGVGMVLAAHLIARTNNFADFPSWRKMACHAGTAPFTKTSGTSLKGRTKVSHMADKVLKTLLNQAALSATLHNPELRAYYQRRVKEGKSKMLVINIVRNKLLARIFAVVRRDTPYVDIYKFAA